MKRRPLHRRFPAWQRARYFFEGLEPRLVMDGVVDNEPETLSIEILSEEISVECVAVDLSNDLRLSEQATGPSDSGVSPGPNGELIENECGTPATSVPPALQHFASAEELQQHLLLQAVDQWKNLFGAPVPYYYSQNFYEYGLADFAVLRSQGGPLGAVPEMAIGNEDAVFSNTNVQVAGVDEGDLVKTDGQYLYLARENRLTIVDARDPAQLHIVSRIALDQPASDLYVDGKRLTVISSHYPIMPFLLGMPPTGILFDNGASPIRWEPRVQVDVYDIIDRAAPKEIASFAIDGGLVQSRAVGSHIVLVTQDGTSLPSLAAHCTDNAVKNSNDGSEIKDGRVTVDQRFANGILPGDQSWPMQTCVYETKEEYVARVSDGLLEQILPHYATGGEGDRLAVFLTEPENIAATGSWLQQLVSTTVIDVSGETPHVTDSAGILTSYASQVYATAEHVYVATPDWSADGEKTRIVEFSLGVEQDSVAVTAIGQVAGHLLNQFAMDEHEGHLRVATSEGWGNSATNSVFVLHSNQEQLVVVGSVTGITPGETIFAARFLGDQAFLVTFARIDPLVALDLSDPANPVVAGELEIPGFSNYLHPLAGGFLIGLGRDANTENGWATDPQISLFDVQDQSVPSLVDREIIGAGSNAWSQAFFDHHAISYFEDVGIFAVPFNLPDWVPVPEVVSPAIRDVDISRLREFLARIPDDIGIRDDVANLPDDARAAIKRLSGRLPPELQRLAGNLLGNRDGTARQHPPRTGLWVFHIDPSAENPIEQVGTISHEQPVERSLRIGNALFVVSHDMVTSHDLTHPDQQLGRVYLGRLVMDDFVTVDVDGGPAKLDVLANDRVPNDARIVAVSQPEIPGGHVTISDDGRSVIYSATTNPEPVIAESGKLRIMPPVQGGNDRFTYTVQLAEGMTETATVSIQQVRERAGRRMAELAVQDLARRLEISADKIQVLRVERREWPDSCLGVPNPDQSCADVVTPGFVVWLAANDHRYEYHTDSDTTVVLVEHHEPTRDGVIPDFFRVHQDSNANELDVLANDFPNTEFIKAPQISAVSETDHGGTVTIQEGGYSLLYTPAPGYHGTETFTYTVDNGPSGKVTVGVLGLVQPPDDPGHGDPLIGIRLEVTDADGNPLTQVELGAPFFIDVYVNDLRKEAQGVFSAYLDVAMNTDLAAVSGAIDYSTDYNNGVSGAVDRSGIDEVGGFSGSLRPLGAGERQLLRIPLEAISVGSLSITTNPADLIPHHDSGLSGIDAAVPVRRIDYGTVAVEIVNGFHNDQDPTDANGDGTTSPTDALPIINWINENGAGSVMRLREAEIRSLAAGLGVHRESRRFDTNGDGHCTHMDVLMVFNRVNNDFDRRGMANGEAAPNGPALVIAGGSPLDSGENPVGPRGTATNSVARRRSEVVSTASSNRSMVQPPSSSEMGEGESQRTGCSEEVESLLDVLTDRSERAASLDALFAELG